MLPRISCFLRNTESEAVEGFLGFEYLGPVGRVYLILGPNRQSWIIISFFSIPSSGGTKAKDQNSRIFASPKIFEKI